MSEPRTAFRPVGIFELAWPAIVGNLLFSIVGIVDVKIVGSLGPAAVAAAGTGQRIFFVLQGVLMAVTAGGTALVARAWGAGDRSEAERTARASLVLCVAVAVAASAVGVLAAHPLAGIFRLEASTRELAAVYIRWMSLFHVGFAASFALQAALRAAGDTRTPLVAGVLTNIVNVFLAYGLVYGAFGLPAIGVAGAAVASGAAFTAGALLLLALWGSRRLRLGPGPPGALSRERTRRLLHVGYPAALEQAAWQAGFIGFLWVVALYGTEAFAAYNIGVQILSLSFVVGFGFSIAASTLVGQHLGAGDPEGAQGSGWRAMRLSVAAMVVLGVSIVAAARPIARLLIDDPEVVRLTVAFIRVLGAVQPLMAIEFSLGGALRGAGDTRFPMITVMTGLLAVRLVLASLFAAAGSPVEWVYGALVADYAVKSSMLVARFRGSRWQSVLAAPEPPAPARPSPAPAADTGPA